MLVRRVVLVVGLALVFALPLVGCGRSVPHLHWDTTLGPKADQATILAKVTSGLTGWAHVNIGIVLTYPDGHRRLLSSGDCGANDKERIPLDRLPSGVCTLTAYAVPGKTSDEIFRPGLPVRYKPFPARKMVTKNVVGSAYVAGYSLEPAGGIEPSTCCLQVIRAG